MGKFIDLTGQSFGRWLVEQKSNKISAGGTRYWWCICQCENHTRKEVDGNSLRSGKSKSCGCLTKERMKNLNFNDLTGQVIDWLTIEGPTNKRSNGNVIWKCKCQCGNDCERSTANLSRKNEFHSCGCYNILKLKERLPNLIGQKFGLLTVLELADELDSSGMRLWICRCECGAIVKIRTSSLTTGNTTSCGCINYSIGEKYIEEILKSNSILFKSQYSDPSLNKKRFDFAIKDEKNNIIRLIEFDGKQHYSDISGIWNSQETLEDIQSRDFQKNKWAQEHNIPLVRIPYWERDNITLEMIMGDKYLIKE